MSCVSSESDLPQHLHCEYYSALKWLHAKDCKAESELSTSSSAHMHGKTRIRIVEPAGPPPASPGPSPPSSRPPSSLDKTDEEIPRESSAGSPQNDDAWTDASPSLSGETEVSRPRRRSTRPHTKTRS
eukprot:scaffold27763_cov36-Phaeocystis_antarctica.AAC.1